MTYAYQESRIDFMPESAADLYAIHCRVMEVTNGDKAITYAPRGLNRDGRMEVILRAMPGVSFPKGLASTSCGLAGGMTLRIQAAVRLVKQSDRGERMPSEDEALSKWIRQVEEGGFRAESTSLQPSFVGFHHTRLSRFTRLPFWMVSGVLTVVDPRQAACTMVHGVGRGRGLGLGKLMVVA